MPELGSIHRILRESNFMVVFSLLRELQKKKTFSLLRIETVLHVFDVLINIDNMYKPILA